MPRRPGRKGQARDDTLSLASLPYPSPVMAAELSASGAAIYPFVPAMTITLGYSRHAVEPVPFAVYMRELPVPGPLCLPLLAR